MAKDNGNQNMANDNGRKESNPLLSIEEDEKKKLNDKNSKEATTEVAISPEGGTAAGFGWTTDELPLAQGSVVGESMGRSQWNSSLFACLGRNDEFCSSDIEVCLIGSVAPCVLYGSNLEILGSRTFATPCLAYLGLCLIGNYYFGWNCYAAGFACPIRTAIRRKFNLEASKSHLSSCVTFLSRATVRHLIGHVADAVEAAWKMRSIVNGEGRELRRKLPHPGFNGPPVPAMIPPGEQTMGRWV
ncbi:hypothetical protein PTKIN_Ptkin13bG0269700 [Pterospermum kingtungense]